MVVNVIETDGLTRKFGDLIAVDSVSIEIRKGELFGLLGPNGAGKTTLLKLLTGQMESTEGSASVLGIDSRKDPMAVKRSIGIVPEVESPPSFLTGREYLQYIGLIRGLKDIERKAGSWIDFLDMKDMQNTMGKDLSKGTRQKLMVAAAFIHEPSLVFLDEPFAGLDPIYQRRLKDHIMKHLEKGGTVFMCTHILEIAEKMCTRLSIIDRGKIVFTGTIDELKEGSTNLESAFMKYTHSGNDGAGAPGEVL